MKTINIAPDNDGLIRWLRHVYTTDQAQACQILVAGWPSLSPTGAVKVLTGEVELQAALEAESMEHWSIPARVKATAKGLVLVHQGTAQPFYIGEQVTDFRGDVFYLRSVEAPRTPESTGRVYVSPSRLGAAQGYYPSVINAEWMPEGVQAKREMPSLDAVRKACRED
jgi:hypothetical protein